MMDFIQIVNNALEEQGKTTEDLFKNKIISKDTFYKYKHRNPSLSTLIKISNFLEVSIDYLFELTNKNDYTPYSIDNLLFYKNLTTFIEKKKISGRQFCKDLHYSRDNLIRWKNGTLPTLQSLLDISNYFNCSIDELLF